MTWMTSFLCPSWAMIFEVHFQFDQKESDLTLRKEARVERVIHSRESARHVTLLMRITHTSTRSRKEWMIATVTTLLFFPLEVVCIRNRLGNSRLYISFLTSFCSDFAKCNDSRRSFSHWTK